MKVIFNYIGFKFREFINPKSDTNRKYKFKGM